MNHNGFLRHSSSSTGGRGQEKGEVKREGGGVKKEEGDTAAIYLMPYPDRGLQVFSNVSVFT